MFEMIIQSCGVIDWMYWLYMNGARFFGKVIVFKNCCFENERVT